MKFATSHKNVKINDGIKDHHYRLHRDYNKVWATQDSKDKSVIVFSHQFEYVSEAKAWMERPDFRVKKAA